MRPLITLLTDFGTMDGYVAEMKGVILSRLPDAQLLDITHELPPQDVDAGRLAIARYWRRFPPGTIHVAVVDPGVGTARAALAVSSDGRYLVGPDNGLLSPALLFAGARCIALPVPAGASATFHGRDVFAPAAAELGAGRALESLGAEMASPEIRRTPEPHLLPDGTIRGEVIAIDRFGNAITNLLALRGGSVRVANLTLPIRRTYGETEIGQPLALQGSTGLVEIAVRNGSAARQLGLARGATVVHTRE